VKYAWINEQRDSFPVSVMCQVLKVSKSGYYDWIDRPLSPRAQRHQRILESVAQVHADSHGIYGSWKVAEELAKRDDLECRNWA
jgi:putative transposase